MASSRTPSRKISASTPNGKFPTLTRAVAGSAVAVAAIASAAAASLTSGAGAATQATAAGSAHAITAGSGPHSSIVLDAVTGPLRASEPAASKAHRTPRQIAWYMLRSYGWSTAQFKYLNWLWTRESGWNPQARNPYSGAYGIPQADPGSKMASAGANWRASATTQIRWGLGYIKHPYGSPRRAWYHEVAFGWY